jgi:hypothetical protein
MKEKGRFGHEKKIIVFPHASGGYFHDSRNIVFHPQLHFPPYPDPFEDLARDRYSRALVTENQEEQNILIDAGQLRTWEYGSLEATQKALDENHIDYAVSLPVMPNSSFEEALAASKLEPRLLPFTSADFRLPIPEMKAKLKRDVPMRFHGFWNSMPRLSRKKRPRWGGCSDVHLQAPKHHSRPAWPSARLS